jgi:hypothetical protein
MPDSRHHRGPHPDDARLFAPAGLDRLREATADLGWLLERGYSDKAALALVGDRFQLHRRQRMAALRCACPPSLAARRRAGRVGPEDRDVVVDGFNVLVTTEAALSGAVLLRGLDGLVRDLCGVHGSYRKVTETARAIELLVARLEGARSVTWYLDRPVSNSGRIAALLRHAGQQVELSDTVDGDLIASALPVATADGPVLDRATAGVDLTGALVAELERPWLVDLSPPGDRST